MRRAFISRFTPRRTDPAILERIFVQRERLLQDIVERIRISASTGATHYQLLVGPRGSGKTHLVSLAVHRTRDAPLALAWLNEDEIPYSYDDLLRAIRRALEGEPVERAEDEEAQLLAKLGQQTCLLVIENLDEVFAGIGSNGQHRLRALLQEGSRFTVLATSQRLFPGVDRREAPFFGFFQTIQLKPLSVEDAADLLQRIAELNEDDGLVEYLATDEGRARVRALHHLAGGNQRIYVILSEFVERQALDELVGMFEELIDALTPFYQERMRWLTPQQRAIVQALCRRRVPASVQWIADELGSSNQSISSQLKTLRELGYVVSTKVGRESRYELAEPLMRMTYEVKQDGTEPIRFVVEFLRRWYAEAELQSWLGDSDPLTQRYVAAALEALRAGLTLEGTDEDIWFQWSAFIEQPDWVMQLADEVGPKPMGLVIRACVAAFSGPSDEALSLIDDALGVQPEVDQFLVSALIPSTVSWPVETRVELLRQFEQSSAVYWLLVLLLHRSDDIEGLDRWRRSFEVLAGEGRAFAFNARLLEVGLDYLSTEPRDPAVLLRLPIEERKIMRGMLGID